MHPLTTPITVFNPRSIMLFRVFRSLFQSLNINSLVINILGEIFIYYISLFNFLPTELATKTQAWLSIRSRYNQYVSQRYKENYHNQMLMSRQTTVPGFSPSLSSTPLGPCSWSSTRHLPSLVNNKWVSNTLTASDSEGDCICYYECSSLMPVFSGRDG